MFNALQYTKNLEESGFEREQAEILVRMFMQMLEFNMVTKTDFEKFTKGDFESFVKGDFEKFVKGDFEKFVKGDFEKFIKGDFEAFRSEVNHKFEKIDERFIALEERIDLKLHKLSLQLTIKLGVMLALSVGLLSTILAIKL